MSERPTLTIWTNVPWSDALMQRLDAAIVECGARRVREITGADVAFGQPPVGPLLAATSVRWVQLTTAGYTRYDTAEVRRMLGERGTILTNASSVYDEPCAQHLLAFIMAAARRLPDAFRNQQDRSWRCDPCREASRLTNDQTLLIVGLGAIGRRLAELVAPLRMNVTAFRRSPRGDEPVPTQPVDSIDAHLPQADHVVNILPDNADTRGFFDAGRLGRMKRDATFYNIGRGTTVDQKALTAALQSRRLRAAYLDVTDPEPLPPDNPLWGAPNCTITPHMAGGFEGERDRHIEHFAENLQRFVKDEPMIDRVM